MKIKVFLPDGAVEVDNVNILISMVKSGVVQPDTIIEAKSRKAKASDVAELKAAFEEKGKKTNQEKDGQDKNANARRLLSEAQKQISLIKSARATFGWCWLLALIWLLLYTARLFLIVVFEILEYDSHTGGDLSLGQLAYIGNHDFNTFSLTVAFLAILALWTSRRLVVVWLGKMELDCRAQEAGLADELRNASY